MGTSDKTEVRGQRSEVRDQTDAGGRLTSDLRPLISLLAVACCLLAFCAPAQSRRLLLLSQQAPATSGTANVTNGLIGWWKLDDGSGSTASDSSGNALNGMLTNSPTWTSGLLNGAMSFASASQVIGIPAHNYGSSLSVCAWVQLSSYLPGYQRIFDTDYRYGYFLGFAVDGRTGLFIVANPSIGTCSGGMATNGQWSHLCGTFDGSSGLLYFNGSLVASNAFTAPTQGSVGAQIAHSVSDNDTRSLAGLLDDVRVYNRALSSNEVKIIYNWRP